MCRSLSAWPQVICRRQRVVQENVNHCDLFATLCELCEIPIPEGLDSRSLAPLLQGSGGDWRNESVSQFGARNLMIKWDDLKYQYYGEEMPEVLFDLERDPSERENFICDEQYAGGAGGVSTEAVRAGVRARRAGGVRECGLLRKTDV